jgi:membrane protease YdiL (CAAX protease family)
MDNVNVSPWFAGVISSLWLGSIITWIWLFALRRQRGAFLTYEPRRPVPWGSFLAFLLVLYVASAIFSSHGTDPTTEAVQAAQETDPSEALYFLLTMIASQAFITTLIVVFTAIISRATPRDLGLPKSIREFVRDVRIGAVAFLAAVAPVHGLQLIVLLAFGLENEPPSHPIVEMIAPGGPNITLYLLASFMAVIVAPLSEEIFFRLLFQGWLEKWEWYRFFVQPVASEPEVVLNADSLTPDGFEVETMRDEPVASEPIVSASESVPDVPKRGTAGLPYGWFPILMSSLLFAVAHFGHGVDPFAIFVLALILGYVYQRTHRVVPCIVTHMLFNSIAMLVLWQLIFVNAK